MIITKKAIPRRTVLRGVGAMLALPVLDAMWPAMTPLRAAAQATPRLGVVYMPNGTIMTDWTPAAEGTAFEFSRILKPLEPFRDRLTVVSGLDGIKSYFNHAAAATRFLACAVPKPELGKEIQAAESIDQIAAEVLGQGTRLASLELALESTESSGSCDGGHSCAYTNTIAWKTPTTPLPMENNPRVVFERMFGDSQSTDPAARLARIAQEKSILDSVTAKVTGISRNLGQPDRLKLGEFLEAVRGAERRIQQAEAQSRVELPVVEQPVGIPNTFEEHAKLMFDLMVLAYQSDLTRVITFMTGREYSGRTYPQVGAPDAHHPTSHHKHDAALMERCSRIGALHSTLFAYYLDKLRSTPDGDGSLLDHIALIYGCGMSDSDAHSNENLPIVVAGGAGGRLKGGRHLKYATVPPVANLHVSLLNMLDVPIEQFANSTGRLDGLSDL